MLVNLAQMPTQSFGERLLLSVAPPLVSAVLGTLIISLFVWWLTDRIQQARVHEERARDRRRAEYDLTLIRK